MKFATKEALVLTIDADFQGPESLRFLFYIDTDAEKIAFINWYLTKVQVTELFNGKTPFIPHLANFPDGSSGLYFKCHNFFLQEEPWRKYEEEERVFPIGSDANKLALFELIITGELDTLFGHRLGLDGDSNGLGWPMVHFKKVKARVPMDTDAAAKVLKANMPTELAEKIVGSAVSED